MRVLVTGGVGFIGSHTVVELINNGDEVVILDNLYNSSIEVLKRIEMITGVLPKFYEVDLLNINDLKKIFNENKFDAVIHFAGLKAVAESVVIPLRYYDNNITGTLNLLKVMSENNVKNIVFSSSATVYGDPEFVPITEDSKVGNTTNPYGSTKLMTEMILNDIYISDKEWSVVLLRYFNPIGAHSSGLIGETPNGIPNNLLPYVAQVASGVRECLSVFGDDYDTVDGTGVRDYIHVVDLAKGHLKALSYAQERTGVDAINLGTGNGTSVLEIVNAFEKASNKKVAYKICERRAGDIAVCYADTKKAFDKLGWKAEKSIDEMCQDLWNFSLKNPDGVK